MFPSSSASSSSSSLSFFAPPPPSLPRANTDNQHQNPNLKTPLLLPTPLATPIKATSMFPTQQHQHHRHPPTLTRANSSTTPANLNLNPNPNPNPNPMTVSPLRHPLQPPPSGSSYSPLRVTTPSSAATRQSGTPAPIARPPAARRADTMALVSPAVDSTLHLAGQSLATGLDVAARRADIIHHLQELAEHQHHAYHHLGGAVVHHQLQNQQGHQQQQMAPSAAYFQQQQSKQQTNPFGSSSSPARYQQQQHRPTAPAPAPAPVPGISSATAARLLPPTMERHISVPSVLPSWLQPTSKLSPPPQTSSAAVADAHQPGPRTTGFIEPNSASMGADLGRDRDPWRTANGAWEQHQQPYQHAQQQQQQPQRAMPATAAGVSPQWPTPGTDVHMDVMSQAGESFNLFQEHACGSASAPVVYYVPHQHQQRPAPSGFTQQQRPQPPAPARHAQMSHPAHASPAQPLAHAGTFHSPQSPLTSFASPALAAYTGVPHNTPVSATANTFFLMGSPLGSPPGSAFLTSVPPNTPAAAGGAADELRDMQVSAATPHYRFETTDSFDPTAPLFMTPAPAAVQGQGGGFVGDFGLVGVLGVPGQLPQQQTQQVYVPLNLFGSGGGGGGGSPTVTGFFGQEQQMQQGPFVAQQQQQQAQGGYQGGMGGFNTSKTSPNYGNLDESLEQHQLNLVPGLNFTMGGGQHHQHHHQGTQHFQAHPNAPPLTPDPNAFALDKKLQPLVWSPTPNPVIRINNISWDMTIFDIQHYLHPLAIARLGGLPLIHILMVRETGKTRSDAYVELDTMNDAMVALRERQRRILRGRVVTLHRASQAELLRLLFPSFVGEFHLVDAVPAGEREVEEGVATSYVAMQRMVDEQRAHEGGAGASAGANAAWLDAFARLALPGVRGAGDESMLCQRSSAGAESMASSFSSAGGGRASTSTSTQGSPTVGLAAGARRHDLESAHGVGMLTQPPTPAPQLARGVDDHAHGQQREYVFLTRTEINQILSVCKNYKLFFSRKCSQRPFENVIVILLKFPWHQRHLLSTLQRDHLFELTKLAIESLRSHLHKPTHAMDPTLMDRMVRAALLVPAFTDRQKAIVLDVAGRVGMAKWVGLEEACREIGAGRNNEMGQMHMQAQAPVPPPPPPHQQQQQQGAGRMPPLPSALAHQLGVPMWSPHAQPPHQQSALDQHAPSQACINDEVDIDFGGGRGATHDNDAMDVSESGFGFGGAGRMFGNGGGNEQAMGSTPPRAAAGYHESQATHANAGGMSPTAPMFVPRYSATMGMVASREGAGDVGGGFQMRDEAAGPARSAEGSGMQY